LKNKGFYLWVVALFSASTFFSCKNDNEQLGLNTGTSPDVTVIDTFSVFTRTVREDSFATSSISLYVLGAVNDNTFGKSLADIVVNFTLPSISSFTFPTGSKIDSVFLVMEYAGGTNYSGNLSTPLNIKAYEITENLNADSVYYSTHQFLYNNSSVANTTTKFNLTDSVKLNFNGVASTQAPQLRLKLDNATFGTKLISASAANLATNTAFQDYVKGLRVAVDNTTLGANQGATAYMYLTNGLSGLHVYYNDTSFVFFPIDKDKSAFANTYSHDFTGTPAATQFTTPGNYNTCYLQSLAGTRILVEIPGLNNLALNDDYAIVGANLVFSGDPTTIGLGFDAPPRLLLISRDSNNEVSVVVDAISEPDLYGGEYNGSSQQYTFNIPRHMQLMFNEYRNNGLDYNKGFYLRVPSSNPVNGSHLILDTEKGTARGIKFKLHVIKVR
jgi:hypothetical protein